ncbi:MAG: D-sedoheptulose 7-phosphate isomerase [Leptospiraceae bacterium]|nr:D-sedoheptulose 7-phosphate isomerase [Leptospiraceae bacterium]MDW8306878.1 D-sedoheptulose 7-phosphate isomerase [Leptospiraceae bacterium]
MGYRDIVASEVEESIATKKKLEPLYGEIEKAGLMLADVLEKGGKILFCGNGGSAADAQHIAAELVVRYKPMNNRRALPALTLSGDPSTITACANDYGYEELFARGVEAYGRSGDALVGITTSGNSPNVIKAVEKARELGLRVLLLLGRDGGKLRGKGDLEIIVPSWETARIQESHILIGHILCSIIEKRLFNLS